MTDKNLNGLSRHIPSVVMRQVRINSKYGCVLCRSGFYQYEHIDPTFEEATRHDPDAICCLCGSCHDAVTRGHISKSSVKAAYQNIRNANAEDIKPPMGPLDFHDGTAELRIGKLHYNPAVHTIIRYHNQDIIRVVPGEKGEPGKISAIFTNCIGDPILELRENVWIGSLDNWDIQINGQRLTVSQGKRRIALKIRLDPPGKVIIERLDMRIGNAHVIATEDTYTVGRYISESEAVWFHADLRIMKATPFGAVLEFIDPELLEERDIMLRGTGQELATHDRNIVMNSNAGVYVKKIGIVVSSLCGAFRLGQFAYGVRSVSDIRNIVFRKPDSLAKFIATGCKE